jgi:hypothetical protein
MHIHGNNLNILAPSLDTPNSVRSENAEKAAETRRRLRKATETLGAPTAESSDSNATFLAGEWLNVRHNYSLAEDKYTRSGRKS